MIILLYKILSCIRGVDAKEDVGSFFSFIPTVKETWESKKGICSFYHIEWTNAILGISFPLLNKIIYGRYESFTRSGILRNSKRKKKKCIEWVVFTIMTDKDLAKLNALVPKHNQMMYSTNPRLGGSLHSASSHPYTECHQILWTVTAPQSCINILSKGVFLAERLISKYRISLKIIFH